MHKCGRLFNYKLGSAPLTPFGKKGILIGFSSCAPWCKKYMLTGFIRGLFQVFGGGLDLGK